MKFYVFALGIFFIAATAVAQTPTPLTATEKINQVYMSSASSMNAAQIAWQNDILGRCTVIDMPIGSSISVNVQELSVVPLLGKYGAALSMDTVYDAATFNPLKYMINYTEDQDQYFRIGTSSKVLKVAANL